MCRSACTGVQAIPLAIVAGLLFLLTHSPESLWAQSAPSELILSKVAPETGFLSPTKYTNAFFGFSMPLPEKAVLNEQTLSLARGPREHLLLSFHSLDRGLVSFTITATEFSGATERNAKKVTESPERSKPRQLVIGGKSFWSSQSAQKASDNRLQSAVYATALNDYVLEFKIVSLLPDTTSELKREIEQIAFFEPRKARLEAGSDSAPYTPGFSPFTASLIGQLDAGSVTGNLYRNDQLKFQYEFPSDWVLMSKAAGKSFEGTGATFLAGNSPAVQAEHEATNQCTKELLFVRRFLQNPPTGQFNPMIVLIAADPKCISHSDFPKSADDHESVQQVARDTLAFFRPREAQAGSTRVRVFKNGSHVVIDISQPYSFSVPGDSAPLTVLSSTLIIESGKYWVVWEFAAGNSVELDQMRATKVFLDDVSSTGAKTANQ